eukprot:m.1308667 g.1308667  ORF g.1308667 m.1308667 type:complete len:1026 (-) comp24820_c0_seq22:2720-5797(-)
MLPDISPRGSPKVFMQPANARSAACVAEDDDENSGTTHTTNALHYSAPTENRRSGQIGVCVKGTRYPVVSEVAVELGFQIVRQRDTWSLYWGDCWDGVCNIRAKQFQKINHFPGMSAICRKDQLGNNLSRLQRIFPTEFDFFPKTWVLPADRGILLAHHRERVRLRQAPTYIYKPENSSQGRGIALLRTEKKMQALDHGIVQEYIPRPLLIDGHKMDFRMYALVTTCVPEFHVFLFDDGLVRLASEPYVAPTAHNLGDTFRHLTNYSLNKRSASFDSSAGDGEGHKRKLSWALQWMAAQGMDTPTVVRAIDDIIVKTILSTESSVKHQYHSLFPSRLESSACCQLLGFDILLDTTFKPWLLEVNMSPSFSCDAQLDADIKTNLIRDTLRLVGLDMHEPARERRAKQRKLRKQTYGKRSKGVGADMKDPRAGNIGKAPNIPHKNPIGNPSPTDCSHAQRRKAREDAVLNNGSGFRRIFPTGDAARDAAYRRCAAAMPSLQRHTAAQEARAKECLEQRARVLQKEQIRYDRVLAEERRKAKSRRTHVRKGPGTKAREGSGTPGRGVPTPTTVPQPLPASDRPPKQAIRMAAVSPLGVPDVAPRPAATEGHVVAPQQQLEFEARLASQRPSVGSVSADLSTLCVHPNPLEVQHTQPTPAPQPCATVAGKGPTLGLLRAEGRGAGASCVPRHPADAVPGAPVAIQLSFDPSNALGETIAPVGTTPRGPVVPDRTLRRGRRRSKRVRPVVPLPAGQCGATDDDVDAILHQLRHNSSTIELNAALHHLQRHPGHRQRGTAMYQPPVVFGLPPPPPPARTQADPSETIPPRGSTITATRSSETLPGHSSACNRVVTAHESPTPQTQTNAACHLLTASTSELPPRPRPESTGGGGAVPSMHPETNRTDASNLGRGRSGAAAAEGVLLRMITVHDSCARRAPTPPVSANPAPRPSTRANTGVGVCRTRTASLSERAHSDTVDVGARACVAAEPDAASAPHPPSPVLTFERRMVPCRSVAPAQRRVGVPATPPRH